jgi:hypothetical protein
MNGTRLTHVGSAKNRQAMHAKHKELTDRMRMHLGDIEAVLRLAGLGSLPNDFPSSSLKQMAEAT